jgi:hypothetical protein
LTAAEIFPQECECRLGAIARWRFHSSRNDLRKKRQSDLIAGGNPDDSA